MKIDRTKEQTISELRSLRQQVADLRASETKHKKAEDWFKGVLDSVQAAIIIIDGCLTWGRAIYHSSIAET